MSREEPTVNNAGRLEGVDVPALSASPLRGQEVMVSREEPSVNNAGRLEGVDVPALSASPLRPPR